MNEQTKQPLILTKIDTSLELIEKLGNILQPVLNIEEIEEEKCSNGPYVSKSIVLSKLNEVNEKLEKLIKLIDIN